MAFRVSIECEKGRLHKGDWASPVGAPFGVFFLPHRSYVLKVVAYGGDKSDWEHVSVSLKNRCPNWIEMCYVKSLFWEKEDCVVQFHPADSEYINNHPYCLHMWRHKTSAFPTPDPIMVGLKGITPELLELFKTGGVVKNGAQSEATV